MKRGNDTGATSSLLLADTRSRRGRRRQGVLLPSLQRSLSALFETLCAMCTAAMCPGSKGLSLVHPRSEVKTQSYKRNSRLSQLNSAQSEATRGFATAKSEVT